MTTAEVGELIGVSPTQMLETVKAQPTGAAAQLGSLKEVIEQLKFQGQQENLETQTIPAFSNAYPVDVKKPIEEPAADEPPIAGPSIESASENTVPLRVSVETLWLIVVRVAPSRKK